jgi:hypothetical protein
LEWVPESSVRDLTFMRAFTRYRQPMVARIMTEDAAG